MSFKVGITSDILDAKGEPVFGREPLKAFEVPGLELEWLPQGLREVIGSEQVREGIPQAENGVEGSGSKGLGETAKPNRLEAQGKTGGARVGSGDRDHLAAQVSPGHVQFLFGEGDDVLTCAASGIQNAERHTRLGGNTP